MPTETFHIRFSPHVDSTRELAAVATDIAFDFAASFRERRPGPRHGVGYDRGGHIWHVWWTKSCAVTVLCEGRAA